VVRLRDFSHAAEIATTWATITGDKVQSWDQINANFFSIFKIQNTMRYLMIAVILVVAGFGIYNVLNMTVTQKRKEIAILRSMGFETSDIIFLFFSQGLILGFLGGLIGLVIGYWICLYLQTVPFGGGPLGGAGYLQISIKPAIYLQAMGLAVFSASLASILPARAAGKMTPIEIIRSGTD
jgi:lipoprotein-releasing system permease protein